MTQLAKSGFAHTLTRHIGIVIAGLAGLLLIVVFPYLVEPIGLIEVTSYLIMALLALSLGLIWGFGGILCFGQSAFFGLGAYAYAIAVINLGDSTVPFLLAIIVPAVFAAMLGYFLFYARISDVYLAVITLTVTLILFKLINSTAGPAYKIGSALIGGYNGIPAVPPLNLPGNPSVAISPLDLFYLSGGFLLIIFFALRLLLASRFGRTIVAIRENERRAGLLGYDTRLYKLILFVIGGAIAGLAGCLYTNWGMYINPQVFGLPQAAQTIIWVIVGGRGTLIGPIVGSIAIQWLSTQLAGQQMFNAGLVLGIVLVVFVLLMPTGIVPMSSALLRRALRR